MDLTCSSAIATWLSLAGMPRRRRSAAGDTPAIFLPVAAQVRLVEVAAVDRDARPGCRRALQRDRERALEASHHRIALWRHADVFGEDLDETSTAQSDRPGDLADLDARLIQLDQRRLDGRPPGEVPGQARHQGLLEKTDP